MMVLPGINKQVISIAESWVNTPYRHQACLKHVGTDCIGLILGIAKEVYGKLPTGFKLPPYTPLWAEESGIELMVDYANAYMTPVSLKGKRPGDVLMFRMVENGPTKHTGILVDEKNMIHSYYPHGVVKTPILTGRAVELTHVFRLPEEIK